MNEQSRLGSLIETVINTAIGFVISYAAFPVAAVALDIEYTGGQHFSLVAFFTFISIVRGYLVRRYANSVINRASSKLAAKLLK